MHTASITLFDRTQRTDKRPKSYAEPAFTFLNRSGRQPFELVRDELECWFARYPAGEKPNLLARFRSRGDPAHSGAFFELFIHELLLRLGCHVTAHPETPSGKCPDFLAEAGSERFFVEATVAFENSRKEQASERRENEVYEVISRLDSPDFYISIDVNGAPNTPPPAKSIRDFIADNIRDLDYDIVSELYRSKKWGELPRWHYAYDGWSVVFSPMPKSPGKRGQKGDPIGVRSFHTWGAKAASAIRGALVEKAGKYGEPTIPYVIAVNPLPNGAPCDEISEALFGDEKITVQMSANAEPMGTTLTRSRNGAWTMGSGPRNQRVSAALIFRPVLPWHVSRADVWMFHNPWARHPYNSVLCALQQASVNGDLISYTAGISLAPIFDLDPDWPGF